MDKFSLIKRGSIYFQGEIDIISLYKNDVSIIASLEIIYEYQIYDSKDDELKTQILWYKSPKHIEDLTKTIDWLNENGSCYEKDKNDDTYLLSYVDKDEELEELYVYEKTDPFLEDYCFILNNIVFVNEDILSPYDGPI